MGVSRQLVSRVLNQDTVPEPSALLRMAQVMQLPSQTLFRAAGYTTDEDPIFTYAEAWEMVIAAVSLPEQSDDATHGRLLLLVQQMHMQQFQDHLHLAPGAPQKVDAANEGVRSTS